MRTVMVVLSCDTAVSESKRFMLIDMCGLSPTGVLKTDENWTICAIHLVV